MRSWRRDLPPDACRHRRLVPLVTPHRPRRCRPRCRVRRDHESLGVRPERVSLVRGAGVDIRRFRPQPEPEGPVRVTMVSRLLWDKGVREFVDAAMLVRKVRSDVVFTLVGAPGRRQPHVGIVAAGAVLDRGQPRRGSGDTARTSPMFWRARMWRCCPATEKACRRRCSKPRPAGGRLSQPMSPGAARWCATEATVYWCLPGCSRAGGCSHGARRRPGPRAAMGAEGRRRAEKEFAAERINQETLRVYERVLALGR